MDSTAREFVSAALSSRLSFLQYNTRWRHVSRSDYLSKKGQFLPVFKELPETENG